MNLEDIYERFTPEFYSDVSSVSEALVKMMENNKNIVSFEYEKIFKRDLIPDDDFISVGKDTWVYYYKLPQNLMDIVSDFKTKQNISILYDDTKKDVDDVILFLCENIKSIKVQFTFHKVIPETFDLYFTVYILDNYIRNIMRKGEYNTKTCTYINGKVVVS